MKLNAKRKLAIATLTVATLATTFHAGTEAGERRNKMGKCYEDSVWVVVPGSDFPNGPNQGRSCIPLDNLISNPIQH